MNVEMGTEAAHFPEKENINGIFVSVIMRDSEIAMGKAAMGSASFCMLLAYCA
jgi:hypothetical protein